MPRLILYALIIIGLLTACGSPGTKTPAPDNTIPPVEEVQPPTVTLSSSTRSGSAPLTVTFTATARPGASETLAYAWDFGDGNTSTGGATRTHTFQEPGSFTTAITVSGTHGSATATQVISVGAAIEPEPEPEPEPSNPFDGRAHLGTWVWIAVTAATEENGLVEFTHYLGAPSLTIRESIGGTWSTCGTFTCTAVGPAGMMEAHLESYGWEHVLSFYNSSGTVRLLGLEFEAVTLEGGQPGYIGYGSYYGANAAIGIAWVEPRLPSTPPVYKGDIGTQQAPTEVIEQLRSLLAPLKEASKKLLDSAVP